MKAEIALSENDLLECVVELAHLLGYLAAHFRPAWTSRGYRTAVSADGAGYPDLTLAKPGRFLVAELKSHHGKLAPNQVTWRDTFNAAGIEYHLWRPADWTSGHIEACLRQKLPGQALAPPATRFVSGP